MLADRRFDFARDLQLSGDLVAAEDLFLQTTDLAPGFATAWFTLGEVRELLGDRSGAIAAFRVAETTDPGDRNGAGLRLMRLGAADLAGMRPTYVTALFDQYAPQVRCRADGRSRLSRPGAAAGRGARRARRGGQAGPLPACDRSRLRHGIWRPRAFATESSSDFIGIDLSPRMIERAACHRALCGTRCRRDRCKASRGQADASADLVLAADAMVYVDDIGAAAARGRARARARRRCSHSRSKPMRARASSSARGCAMRTPPTHVRALDRRRGPCAARLWSRIVAQRKQRAGARPGRGRGEALNFVRAEIKQAATRAPRCAAARQLRTCRVAWECRSMPASGRKQQ